MQRVSGHAASAKHPAPARGAPVRRERLADRARRALGDGGLLLSAGAGFGKTTLLEQVLAESRAPVAWVACTESDRDGGLLIVRVARALAAAVPGATDALVDRLATGDQIDADAVTTELITELRRLLIDPVVLVFDDAEQLGGATESLRIVSRLLHADLQALHVAVASRHALDLPPAHGAGPAPAVIGTEDLVFSGEDCAALLRERTGFEPNDRVGEVLEATEGWPLGVAVAADVVARRGEHGDHAAPLGALASAPGLRTYLSDELLRRLDPDLRTAALRASAADRVTPAVNRALALPPDLATQLEHAGVPVRRGGDAFGYHPLLREFLLERLGDELDPAELRELHSALARAAIEDGDPVSAVRRWLDAGAHTEAAETIETQGFDIVRTSPALVRGWIAELPADIRARPTLRVLEGHSLWLAGAFDRALPALRGAVSAFAAHPNPPAEWLARSILVDVLFVGGDPDGLEPAVDGWDRPEAEGAFALAPAAAMYAASCLASYGRIDASDDLAAAALASDHSEWIAPFEGLRSFFVDLPAGRLDDALARAGLAVRELERVDPLSRLSHALGALAAVHAERGERDEALALWHEIRERTRLSAPVLADASHAWCALLHAQAGRLDEAEAELAQHRRLESGGRSFVADLAPAAIAALRGDADAVERAGSAALLTTEGGPLLFRYAAGADLAPSLAAVGRTRRAAEVVESTLAVMDAGFPGERGAFVRGRLMAQRAWLAHEDGDTDRAYEALLAARQAAGAAARHVLRREWDRLQPVVWDALADGRLGDAGVAVGEIDRAFPGGRELVPFLDHPVREVRALALEPAVRSGDSTALAALDRLRRRSDPSAAVAAERSVRRLARMLPPLRFSVLGPFGVTRGSWVAGESDWQRPIDARLVRLLLTALGGPVPEDLVFEALWPELPEQSARRSLQVAASRARKVIDPPGTEQSAIEARDHRYRLVLGERDTVDAEEFRTAATAALRAGDDERRARLERARALWSAEPMPEERYSTWAVTYRERLADQHGAVLTELTRIYERAGEHVAAASTARELVDTDPLNEGAHRALMTAYARGGRTGHALRQYLECRRTLVETLGIEPGAATETLQARILAGESV